MSLIYRYLKTVILTFLVIILSLGPTTMGSLYAIENSEDNAVYTTLRSIDLGTFNEYRYRITEQFFNLRENFEVYGVLDDQILKNIALLADTGYTYLPDNLQNQNYLRELLLSIKKGQQNPNNEMAYIEVVRAISDYLEKVEISSMQGQIQVTPESGNAPLTVTFRSNVEDPSGTQIKSGSYTWWIDDGGIQKVIGRGPSINYTFRNEGNFSVFLDVTSSHKNNDGNTDVLPYRGRAQVTVQEKVASLIIKINGESVGDQPSLKFTPDDASYGLLFDATSSTPTSGAQFVETSWDFGNGVTRTYRGSPQIERVRYGRDGEYDVRLRLTTNEGKVVEKDFVVSIRDPIATIQVSQQDGYIGDVFTFSAKDSGFVRNLTYNWEILDIDDDRVVFQKADKTFSYSFVKKGRYNVRLKVREPSGEVDQDTRIVYITSQAPIAEFQTSKPFANKPNRALLDASKTFDPDFSDDGKLSYTWYIDGNKVALEDANANGSVGYYTFDSIGTHSINLEVIDPDGIMATKKGEVKIDSILSVEMFAFPRVIQREGFIKFVAESPEAEVFEWDFGDGQKTGGDFDKVTHTYEKSGKFDVKLTVSDGNNNTNTISQTVYVSDSGSPYAYIDVSYGTLEKPVYDSQACGGAGAYIVNRVNNIKFDASESININGENSGLEYSWKIGQSKFSSAQNVTQKFDELGCFPVKLTVKSTNNGKTHSQEVMVDVVNMLPTLSSLNVDIDNPDTDPLIVRVSTQGATDPDGVIQSYLWYYYTSTDPEPQDFRSTSTSSTAFVIPKIAETYYFVVILKDNNEARVTSEEATGSKYFETISGDNINTPIVELTVNDNSAVIGEEVVFTASAHNVLGKTIDKDVEYSWDFDGDGFYDTQTSTPTTTYSYTKSGEFHAKVKVKYRGVSGIKNTTINVNNKLTPDFGYISVGNTFVFFDSSDGSVDARQWDLGDGTKKSGTNFTHTYTDNKPVHRVTLKISEGTKTKEITKTIKRDLRNMVGTGKGFSFFSYPTAEDGKIVLESPTQKVFVYLGESGTQVANYGIDYNIEYDSNFNGVADDDEDNAGTPSARTGEVVQIPLNEYVVQTIRAFTKDADGNVLGSQDLTIEKTYIEEENINPDLIVFENVTPSEKEKIEALKAIISELPQNQRLEAFSYVQKLQESWNDPTEKTRTILDFENYIFSLMLPNEQEVISLLESLLVEGQEDQSNKQITYQALVNLVPQDIECEIPSEDASCHDYIVEELTTIKDSNNVEENKAIGKNILGVIAATDLMTNQQKLDFKAILTSLVYGGDIQNIPESEKEEVIGAEGPANNGDSEDSGGILGFLWGTIKVIFYIILLFAFIVLGLYILYKIVSRGSDESFSQFITKITTFNKNGDSEDTGAGDIQTDDILGEVDKNSTNSKPADAKKENTKSDQKETQKKSGSDTTNTFSKPEKPVISANPDDIPSIPDDSSANTSQDPLASVAEDVPDWLKGSFSSDDIPDKTPEPLTSANVAEPKSDTPTDEEIETATKIDDSTVPDWLKGTFTQEDTSDNLSSSGNTEKSDDTHKPVKEEITNDTDVPGDVGTTSDTDMADDDINVPDWLKGSFDDTDSGDIDVTLEQETTTKETIRLSDDSPSKKTSSQDSTKENDDASEVVEKNNADIKDSTKKTQKKSQPKKKPSEKLVEKTKEDSKKETSSSVEDAKSTEKTSDTSGTKKKTTKKGSAASNTKKKSQKKEDVNTDTSIDNNLDSDLWDDGMKIPDWLTADDDESSNDSKTDAS